MPAPAEGRARTARPRADYGYDAPYALMAFAVAAIASTLAAGAFVAAGNPDAALGIGIYAVFFATNASSFAFTTRVGKFVEWERILDGVPLRGDERVLDIGCGRGAVLMAVARRLPAGHVIGIDVWSGRDQSGNAGVVTFQNAEAEGVRRRIALSTADARALPFPDAAFDLIVSSLAIHNIAAPDRQRAIIEAFRVLKPGGRLVITDIRATRSYAQTLRERGATPLTRRRLGWRFWWGNPIAATSLLTATKPAR